MKRRKRVTSALLALILVLQCVGMPGIVQEVKAESPALPSPVLDVSFDSLQQTAGTALTGSFEAETGQEVKVHDKVTVTEGKDSGKAVLLDNKSGQTGYLTTPNTDKLNPQNLSVSMWIKRTGTTNNTEGRILWAKETNATDANPWMSDGWFLGWTGGESMAYVTNGKNMAVQKGNSDDLLDENEWVHLAATFDSTTGAHVLYKNGQPFATSTTAGASISRNADAVDLMIGKSGYGNAGLGCVVDSIQIYDQVLSARQVGQLAGTSEEEFFQSDYDALSVPARVSQDFQILTKGAGGTDISWKSDNRAITFDGNTAKVARAAGDVTVKLTATLTLGELKKTKEFSVLIAGTDAASSALKHLDWDEIVDVGGVIGTRLKESMNNYAYEYLYKTKMQGYLNEYKNHSHSSWSWLEGEQPGKWLETMSLSKWMNDSRYDAAIKDVADQLAKYQLEANPNATDYSKVGGYLGNGTAAIRANKPVKGMDPYEMYSTLNGLMETYENYAKMILSFQKRRWIWP